MRVGLCQIRVEADLQRNWNTAEKAIANCVSNRATLVCLPECWNAPYGSAFFPKFAERIGEGGQTWEKMSGWAKQYGVHLVGGSIAERDTDTGNLYNTSCVFDPSGAMIAKHRKVHLFDISVPGGITFKESETLSAGSSITSFRCNDTEIGLGICYDIRFPELAMVMARERGCSVLIFPSAFNMTTGPLHWELLARSRAVDNQVFTIVVSPARDMQASYHAWGHTMAVSPWGKILGELDENEGCLILDLDLKEVEQFRNAIPTSTQRRNDIYELVVVKKQ